MPHAPIFTKLYKRVVAFALFGVLLGAAGSALFHPSAFAATSPTLGAAGPYSVLAGSTVTNTGPTTTTGAVGVSPGTAITGFPPGTAGGGTHSNDASAIAAQAANTAAFTFLDQVCDITYAGVQDLTLVSPLGPGVYCADAFLLTGNLTLSGSGVWIFKSAATLTTSSNSSVTGGDPCNVWWRLVSSGTLGTGTSFMGNILALASISLQTGASLNGRALAQTGQVSLDANIITGPSCGLAPTGTPPATSIPTNTPVPVFATQVPTATATQVSTATATQVPTATATRALTPTGAATPTTPGAVQPPQTGDAGLLQDTRSSRPMAGIALVAVFLLGAVTIARLGLRGRKT